MDIKIIDVDIENGTLYFLYASPLALQKVKRELLRIGHPIQSCKFPASDMRVRNGNGMGKTIGV